MVALVINFVRKLTLFVFASIQKPPKRVKTQKKYIGVVKDRLSSWFSVKTLNNFKGIIGKNFHFRMWLIIFPYQKNNKRIPNCCAHRPPQKYHLFHFDVTPEIGSRLCHIQGLSWEKENNKYKFNFLCSDTSHFLNALYFLLVLSFSEK